MNGARRGHHRGLLRHGSHRHHRGSLCRHGSRRGQSLHGRIRDLESRHGPSRVRRSRARHRDPSRRANRGRKNRGRTSRDGDNTSDTTALRRRTRRRQTTRGHSSHRARKRMGNSHSIHRHKPAVGQCKPDHRTVRQLPSPQSLSGRARTKRKRSKRRIMLRTGGIAYCGSLLRASLLPLLSYTLLAQPARACAYHTKPHPAQKVAPSGPGLTCNGRKRQREHSKLATSDLQDRRIGARIRSVSAPITTHSREPLQPILTAHLFPKVDGLLLELLRSLAPEDWEKQTVSPKWKVKDVAAHLLDTPLRGLSIARDGYFPPAPKLDSPAALGAYIDRLNEEGVSLYRRLSPAVLISLMQVASQLLAEYHHSRDPDADAPYGVSWAGEENSSNWFDTAREFTERWHHQQQIRLAVNKSGIMTCELYHPVLDCFLQALPFTYRNVPAKPGTLVGINVVGECGGIWHLYRSEDSWQLIGEPFSRAVCEVTIPQEIAWRICTKGIDTESALAQ